MRRFLLFLILVVTVFPVSTAAQAQRLYKLHPVSPAEFVDAVNSLKAKTDIWEAQTLSSVLANDYSYQYLTRSHIVHYSDLIKAYHQWLSFGALPETLLKTWTAAIVAAWLNENSIDLDKVVRLTFGSFKIGIVPRDFKGDGGHEWLLTTDSSLQTSFQHNYLIAERKGNDSYEVIDTPLPWFTANAEWEGYASEQPLLFQDINGDGIPEWVVEVRGLYYGFADHGSVAVLEWHDGRIVDLAPAIVPYPYGVEPDMDYAIPYEVQDDVSVDFARTGSKADILIHESAWDNWGCTGTFTRTFSWNGATFAFAHADTVYNDVPGCAWRRAEQNMWDDNPDAAIADYEHGFALLSADPSAEDPERKQYIGLRLALAYAMTGQTRKAGTLINVLKSLQPASPLIAELLDALPYTLTPDPLLTCATVYGVFKYYNDLDRSVGDPPTGPPTGLHMGETIDDYVIPFGGFNQFFPDPSRAGCDVSIPIWARIKAHTFITAIAPSDQLRALGLFPAYTVSMDLNHDGHYQWLVWLTLKTPPLFFAPTADSQRYDVSYAPFSDSFDTYNGVVRVMPDSKSSVLIRVLTDHIDKQLVCPADGSQYRDGWPDPVGTLVIWRLQAGALVQVLSAPVCDGNLPSDSIGTTPILPVNFAGYVPDTTLQPNGKIKLEEAQYGWNSALQTYIPGIGEQYQAPMPEILDPFQIEDAIDQAFIDQDYTSVLYTIDHTLISLYTNYYNINIYSYCDNATYLELHYWRATALELLGRDTEAVGEYLFVAENAPTEAWHDLAMLHLETVDF